MTTDMIKELTESSEALYFLSNGIKIKNYLSGKHKVLERKDFTFKGETLKTSKIALQTIKSIIDFHTSYLVGNYVTLSGENDIVKIFNGIYKKGGYSLTDYKVVDNLTKYGNAYEYLYSDNGVIKSRVIDNLDGYPIYDDMGKYVAFIEHWSDVLSNNSYYIVYETTMVSEYSTEPTGSLVLTAARFTHPLHKRCGEPLQHIWRGHC